MYWGSIGMYAIFLNEVTFQILNLSRKWGLLEILVHVKEHRFRSIDFFLLYMLSSLNLIFDKPLKKKIHVLKKCILHLMIAILYVAFVIGNDTKYYWNIKCRLNSLLEIVRK